MLFAAQKVPEGVILGVLIGGAVIGTACGIMPLRAGSQRGRTGLGVAGMISCVLSGLVLGCLLALPVAFLFTWLIKVLPPVGPHPEPLAHGPFHPHVAGTPSSMRQGPVALQSARFFPPGPTAIEPEAEKPKGGRAVQVCILVFVAVGIAVYQTAVAPKVFPTVPGQGINLDSVLMAGLVGAVLAVVGAGVGKLIEVLGR